jgi:hypothetical protein
MASHLIKLTDFVATPLIPIEHLKQAFMIMLVFSSYLSTRDDN